MLDGSFIWAVLKPWSFVIISLAPILVAITGVVRLRSRFCCWSLGLLRLSDLQV